MAIIDQVITDKYAIYNGDSMEVLNEIGDEKIHLSIYSPPFGGLYHYSSDERDLSNCLNYDEFFKQYEFFVSELKRVTMKGRITAVHCTDVPSSNSGKDHYIDFPGDIIRLHNKYKFNMIARHTIWKEPLWVRNRTMIKNLSHMTIVKDAAYGGVAAADYLLIFRRDDGVNQVPIQHPTGFEYYAGECPVPQEFERFKNWTGDQKENRWSHMIWRRYASCIWDDIRMNRVVPFEKKAEDDEKHVHPLQLDIIDRCIQLRSNPGEKVFTPFMGVGSEVFSAVTNGRYGIGCELKETYFKQAIKNMQIAENDKTYKTTKQLEMSFD
ncbi:MAG: DNA methyltransferase [Candidatus Paceibacterota bacterium]|jgi:DNA modification methylase